MGATERPELGLHIYSMHKEMVRDFYGTLEHIAGMGYRAVELYFDSPLLARFDVPAPAAEVHRVARGLGLRILASTVHHHPFLDWDEVIRYNVELGSGGITIPMHLYNLTQGRTKPQEAHPFAKVLDDLGRKCRASGLRLRYHNYYNEFETFDGKRIFDILLEETDPDLVGFEFDPYWAFRGGVDPVAWMGKLGARCEALQLQDLHKEAKNVNLVEVDGAFDNAFYPKIHTHYGDYVEIGTGQLDFPAIVAKAKAMPSVRYLMVNQMESTVNGEHASAVMNFEAMTRLLAR